MIGHELEPLYDKITEGLQAAVAEAMERHRRLGESICVWREGRVVTLTADQIPLPELTPQSHQGE